MSSRCFAAWKDNTCKVLNHPLCIGNECSFYKTDEEKRQGQDKAYRMIAEMEPERQEYISAKYYNYEMPWFHED